MPGGHDDDDSLFGSPTPSPIRGRSPALALPGAGGGNYTKNVGTIALPGSHAYIELPTNTPALSLNGSKLHEQSQRPPAVQSSQTQFGYQMQPSPSRSDSAPLERAEKKKKSSRENSSAPRAPPPPIHLPDPDVPPPLNFLRNQQALLGTAGLVGGVHPAKLSVERHTRGSTPLNPIIVEDNHHRPVGRTFKPQPVAGPSKIVPPSNEEIIASLIREKNVYPVLESILSLIQGGRGSNSENNSSRREVGEEPVAKRRRTHSRSGDRGHAPGADLEKERGKELIAQLVILIKNAARQAAARAYQQQNLQARRANPNQQRTPKPSAPEPKILGHYRPITATYGRPEASLSDVLADQSNTTFSGSQPPPGANLSMRAAQQVSSPLNLSLQQQPVSYPMSTPVPIVHPPNSFDHFLSSLLENPAASGSVPGWIPRRDLSPSGSSVPEVDQGTVDTWMSLFGSFLSEETPSETALQLPSEFDIDLIMSPPGFSPHHESVVLPEHGFQNATASLDPSCAIDPFLLTIPAFTPTVPLPAQDTGGFHDEPTPATVETGGASTSRAVLMEQGPSRNMTVQDPVVAASTLLHFASVPSLIPPTPQPPSQNHLEAPIAHERAPRPTYQLFPDKGFDGSAQPLRTVSGLQQGSRKEVTLRPMPTADKQDILARAKERRRQLVGEIDRAKVELWETTIEQGVLAQLVKENL